MTQSSYLKTKRSKKQQVNLRCPLESEYNQTGNGFTIYFLTLSSSLNIAGNLEMSIEVRMDKVLGSYRSPITHEANKKIRPLLTLTGGGKFSSFILLFQH